MANSRKVLVTVFFSAVSLFVRTSIAQQVEIMPDEQNNSRLIFIVKNNMGNQGRTIINRVFEKSKSNIVHNFEEGSNKFSITVFPAVYESQNPNQQPNQPCRPGKITATIGGESQKFLISGCRNDQAVWHIVQAVDVGREGDQASNIPPSHSDPPLLSMKPMN